MGRRGQRIRAVSRCSRNGKLHSDADPAATGAGDSAATLFAFQILLGVVFGLWGIALALPLIAVVKVIIDHFKADESPAAATA